VFSVTWWQERLYPTRESRDPVCHCLQELDHFVSPESRVLDIGAGAGNANTYALKGRCREIVGVDLDPRVAGNPLLDRGVVADACRLPFPDESFDVAQLPQLFA